MTDAPNKRKGGPGPSQGGGPPFKKSRGGKGGRWQTPQQKSRNASKVAMGKRLDVGDEGIWVSYARSMQSKAAREFTDLCNEYAQAMWNVQPPGADKDKDKEQTEDNSGDIEASIEEELNALKASRRPKTRQLFSIVPTGIECIFFVKTMKPVDPVQLVRRICEDAKNCPNPMKRRCKYINRLTPVIDTDRATEKGIERVARSVLAPHFKLKPSASVEEGEGEGEKGKDEDAEEKLRVEALPHYKFAIRQSVRSNKELKSGHMATIDKIAKLIDERHTVDLTKPDKFILVEIFQLYCGMSVVDGDWDSLKKFNMNELYREAFEAAEEEEEENKGKQDKEESAKPTSGAADATSGTTDDGGASKEEPTAAGEEARVVG